MSIKCEICKKQFLNRSNSKRHTRNVHKMQTKVTSYDKNVWNYKCLEDNCNLSFHQNKGLIAHLTEAHDLKFDTDEIFVQSMDEFITWKSTIERTYLASYIFKAKYKYTNSTVTYYNCNRSRTGKGLRDETKQYKRRLKTQGSCKLDTNCTSQIILIHKSDENLFVIRWLRTHYGHNPEIKHLRLPIEGGKEQKSITDKVPTEDKFEPCTFAKFELENCGSKSWKVINKTEEFVSVKRLLDESCCKDVCCVCVHMYACTCSDYREYQAVCEHIHYVLQHVNTTINQEYIFNLNKADRTVTFITDDDKLLISNDNTLRSEIEKTFSNLQSTNFNNFDQGVIDQINYHLQVINTLTLLSSDDDEVCTDSSRTETIGKQVSVELPVLSKRIASNMSDEQLFEEMSLMSSNSSGEEGLIISTSAMNDHMY